MDESYMVGCKLIFPCDTSDGKETGVLRRGVAALDQYHGAGFQPRGSRSARVLDGHEDAIVVSVVHAAYPDPNSWVSLSLGGFEAGVGLVYVNFHLGEAQDAEDDLDQEWAMGMVLTPRLVAEFHPTVAFLTAWHTEAEDGAYPPQRVLPGCGLPEQFTPWTYFSSAGLTDRLRDQLTALAAYTSGPHGDGWLVQAVQRPADEPAKAFLDALWALDPEGISYRRPQLTIDL